MSWNEVIELVERAKTGDRAAYGELVRRFETSVYAMALQRVDNVYDLEWAPGVSYGEVRLREEIEQSKYVFGQVAMPAAEFGALHRDLFEQYYRFTKILLDSGLVWPALEHCLKCSHLFNLLDARGAISVTERTGYIGRVRNIARIVAREYLEQRKRLGYPLLKDENLRQQLLQEVEVEG
jgi:glycyl-tRNA synthetase alpha chain